MTLDKNLCCKRRLSSNLHKLFTHIIKYPYVNHDTQASPDALEPTPSVFLNTEFIHTMLIQPDDTLKRTVQTFSGQSQRRFIMPTTHIKTHSKTKISSPQQHRPLTRSPAPVAHNPAAIIQRARAAAESLSAADVLQLQRTIGNQAVGRLLAEVSRLPSRQAPVQRQEEPVDDELLLGKMAVQRQPEPEEEELLQGTFTDECVQCQMPEEEEELMQGQGQVRATMQLKDGVPVNDDEGLEHEADVMGAKAAVAVVQPRRQKARPDPSVQAKVFTTGQDVFFIGRGRMNRGVVGGRC